MTYGLEEPLDCGVDVDRSGIEHRHSRVSITEKKWELRPSEDYGLDSLDRKASDHGEEACAGLVQEPGLDKLGEILLVPSSSLHASSSAVPTAAIRR